MPSLVDTSLIERIWKLAKDEFEDEDYKPSDPRYVDAIYQDAVTYAIGMHRDVLTNLMAKRSEEIRKLTPKKAAAIPSKPKPTMVYQIATVPKREAGAAEWWGNADGEEGWYHDRSDGWQFTDRYRAEKVLRESKTLMEQCGNGGRTVPFICGLMESPQPPNEVLEEQEEIEEQSVEDEELLDE